MKRTIAATALMLAILPATAYADTLVDVGTVDAGGTEYRQHVEYAPEVRAEDFRVQGVVTDGSGQRFTWYSQRTLPGDGLDALNGNGRHVDGNGYVVDGDGFIALASPDWDEPVGTVVETPMGLGRVYDACGTDAYDLYTSWE